MQLKIYIARSPSDAVFYTPVELITCCSLNPPTMPPGSHTESVLMPNIVAILSPQALLQALRYIIGI